MVSSQDLYPRSQPLRCSSRACVCFSLCFPFLSFSTIFPIYLRSSFSRIFSSCEFSISMHTLFPNFHSFPVHCIHLLFYFDTSSEVILILIDVLYIYVSNSVLWYMYNFKIFEFPRIIYRSLNRPYHPSMLSMQKYSGNENREWTLYHLFKF